jgi:hypothetical protein
LFVFISSRSSLATTNLFDELGLDCLIIFILQVVRHCHFSTSTPCLRFEDAVGASSPNISFTFSANLDELKGFVRISSTCVDGNTAWNSGMLASNAVINTILISGRSSHLAPLFYRINGYADHGKLGRSNNVKKAGNHRYH